MKFIFFFLLLIANSSYAGTENFLQCRWSPAGYGVNSDFLIRENPHTIGSWQVNGPRIEFRSWRIWFDGTVAELDGGYYDFPVNLSVNDGAFKTYTGMFNGKKFIIKLNGLRGYISGDYRIDRNAVHSLDKMLIKCKISAWSY
ncbi:MAG: hypothetical protein KA715_14295 [Xanthomonadaceae bacterium]|nr:hypothetical protein [Xanthomonadaceae bacterium]